ncbi:MAG TPA: response regulator transcription factor [Armatimonadota bacterium]|nr:response regulator transcription factor [Armatimonadota bacterium]
MSIRILIADDHAVFRSGLRGLLDAQPDFEVVGECGGGEETVDAVRTTDVDVLILDITMPDMSGPRVAEAVLEDKPDLAIVVLTMHDDASYAEELLNTGARGFVLKRSSSAAVFDAVRAAHQDQSYIDPLVAGQLIARHDAEPAPAGASGVLTPREMEVCAHWALGLTSNEIGEELDISGRTVEAHRAKILKKLGAKGRADVVRFAVKHGMLDVEAL